MIKAVIDLGTNSTRLAVGSLSDGGLEVIYNEVAYTRMGEGMGENHWIQPEPLARNVKAIQAFVRKAQELQAEQIRLTATSAVREASNQQAVVETITTAVGLPLEVLPGTEEARLSYLGASGDFLTTGQPVAVLDIGGGSTELVYPAGVGLHSASVRMGAVRLAENPALMQQAKAVLQGLQTTPIEQDFLLVVTGGTNTALMAMELGLETYAPQQIHGRRMEKAVVDHWTAKLLAMSLEERLAIKGLKPQRADIIPYGAFLLQQVMELLGKNSVLVSDKGLVYGLLLDEK